MNNRVIYDRVCATASRVATRSFSTSFSLGISLLDKRFHEPVEAIYGFVRFADEIVDTFLQYPQQQLLDRFKEDTHRAIADRLSLNPILHSFQRAVHRYDIEASLIDTFLRSMQMDLERRTHDESSLKVYVLGSAEVVGLMCLRVFCEGDREQFERLRIPAMKLASAFQKVNFLRDLREDAVELGRAYFPGLDPLKLDEAMKAAIEQDILAEFEMARAGVAQLPRGARMGVHLAYLYYRTLFNKIRRLPAHRILQQRIRVPAGRKLQLFIGSYIQHRLDLA